ncbi:RagB/SusD family nutrient uptake outer membrane protein [Chitinophaga sp. GCM10012297]|uniref:RagB/SusD family nutrient uptake outer membrane protein n=1 Tax=Chitinophaga chungangae TaxID=2821488 RepID=A0ABS3YJ48_9BACT|nr:RagB/SusD family nutrient uptake outer membrane protein [Chitinophaga chungangae]MBO9154726.1 RagB/SusD family nutrient uptake outer membrane protein [Chitinophaga chungangae]
MKIFKIPLFVLAASLLCSCEKLFNPNNDNHSTLDRVYVDPAYAEGLLIKAYTYIPTNDYPYNEIATDDAATNDKFSAHLRMATGGWSALSNPESLWDNANRAIMYANQFLDVVEIVPWKYTDPQLNALYIRRLKGEALALRGMFKYYLLRNHGGYGSNGELLGFPIYNEFLATPEQFATPRSSFAESLKSTYDDLDSALALLSPDYGNIGSPIDLPPGFTDITDIDKYNTVFGEVTQQRISGRITLAIKARTALLAASPAFNSGNDPLLWENAAKLTADVLAQIGGIDGLDPKGNIFYLKAQVDNANLTAGDKMDIPEMLWRRPVYTNRVREQDNFPPTLFGRGEINPSQNLVDAFPMKNGYPITEAASGFDAANPYTGRDPRLALYIVYNGSKMRNTTINTGVGAGNDGLDALPSSTRTGYYLKKLLREDVNVNPVSTSDQKHFNTHIRYTELFLNYAEAANEAWGPDGTGSQTYSARNVIAAIRKRAGITQPDDYLQSVSGKDAMRQLIHNERRLELCFEGFRFWDLRRWNVSLNEPLKGVKIVNGTYEYFTVEERAYNNSYMHYGPLPDREISKFNLIQNKGW